MSNFDLGRGGILAMPAPGPATPAPTTSPAAQPSMGILDELSWGRGGGVPMPQAAMPQAMPQAAMPQAIMPQGMSWAQMAQMAQMPWGGFDRGGGPYDDPYTLRRF